jgi:hypothetical protein
VPCHPTQRDVRPAHATPIVSQCAGARFSLQQPLPQPARESEPELKLGAQPGSAPW